MIDSVLDSNRLSISASDWLNGREQGYLQALSIGSASRSSGRHSHCHGKRIAPRAPVGVKNRLGKPFGRAHDLHQSCGRQSNRPSHSREPGAGRGQKIRPARRRRDRKASRDGSDRWGWRCVHFIDVAVILRVIFAILSSFCSCPLTFWRRSPCFIHKGASCWNGRPGSIVLAWVPRAVFDYIEWKQSAGDALLPKFPGSTPVVLASNEIINCIVCRFCIRENMQY